VIILDEPTASLDAKAERELFDLFDELEKDRLGIMITHRLSSTVTADRIIVLDRGVLVECGSHRDLMKRRGVYFSLFEMQASAYREEAAV
jgi:ABC-type multidrug transport system fused ATPase/permease subunit